MFKLQWLLKIEFETCNNDEDNTVTIKSNLNTITYSEVLQNKEVD